MCDEIGGEIPSFLTKTELNSLSYQLSRKTAIFFLDLKYSTIDKTVRDIKTGKLVNNTHWRDAYFLKNDAASGSTLSFAKVVFNIIFTIFH